MPKPAEPISSYTREQFILSLSRIIRALPDSNPSGQLLDFSEEEIRLADQVISAMRGAKASNLRLPEAILERISHGE